MITTYDSIRSRHRPKCARLLASDDARIITLITNHKDLEHTEAVAPGWFVG